jgi:hypothetical protein
LWDKLLSTGWEVGALIWKSGEGEKGYEIRFEKVIN